MKQIRELSIFISENLSAQEEEELWGLVLERFSESKRLNSLSLDFGKSSMRSQEYDAFLTSSLTDLLAKLPETTKHLELNSPPCGISNDDAESDNSDPLARKLWRPIEDRINQLQSLRLSSEIKNFPPMIVDFKVPSLQRMIFHFPSTPEPSIAQSSDWNPKLFSVELQRMIHEGLFPKLKKCLVITTSQEQRDTAQKLGSFTVRDVLNAETVNIPYISIDLYIRDVVATTKNEEEDLEQLYAIPGGTFDHSETGVPDEAIGTFSSILSAIEGSKAWLKRPQGSKEQPPFRFQDSPNVIKWSSATTMEYRDGLAFNHALARWDELLNGPETSSWWQRRAKIWASEIKDGLVHEWPPNIQPSDSAMQPDLIIIPTRGPTETWIRLFGKNSPPSFLDLELYRWHKSSVTNTSDTNYVPLLRFRPFASHVGVAEPDTAR